MLPDHFTRIVLLSLSTQKDRADAALARLEESGMARRGDVTVMRAWPGNVAPAPAWWRAGNAAWGCLMSHVRAVQEALLDGVERVLLLEDDVVFHPRAPQWLERLMREVPEDWDQLYLGGQHLKEASPLPDCPYIWRAKNVNRTHAYALHRRVYAKYLQHVLHAPDYIRRGAWHVDHQLGVAHERGDWRTYAPSWWLCAQEAGGSNISGKMNPRMWWQPFVYAKRLPFMRVEEGVEEVGGAKCKLAQLPGEDVRLSRCARLAFHFEEGLGAALKDEAALRKWMETAARHALDRYQLPAWQDQRLTVERVRALWPAGVRELEDGNPAALLDYPENGLFLHPLTEPARPPVRLLSPGFAA